jgi:hypothetical protein
MTSSNRINSNQKKSLLIVLIALIVSLAMCSRCNTKETEATTIQSQESEVTEIASIIPEDVTWYIAKEEPSKNVKKDMIEVLLNKKVDESVLTEIAQTLRSTRTQYERLFIMYNIEGMSDMMAWATSHYNPHLEVKIMGSTNEEDAATSDVSDIPGEIIGKWRSEKSLMGAVLILYKAKNNKLMMKIVFSEGGEMLDEIVKSKQAGKVKYTDDNSHGEYYLVEENGNLGMYGENGKFDEAVKVE